MHLKRGVFFGMTLMSAMAWADSELPAKMQGKWKASSGSEGGAAVIVLKKADGPDRAEVTVSMDTVPNGHFGFCSLDTVATTAERKDDSWQITASNPRCSTFNIVIKPVEGKQRFEGSYTGSRGTTGSVYYEWSAGP